MLGRNLFQTALGRDLGRYVAALLLLPLALVSRPAWAAEFTRDQPGGLVQLVGRILEHGHYKQARLGDDISLAFLKNYLDALDYNHLVFLQTDVDEFDRRFGASLDNTTLDGSAAPAFAIFARYLARLNERHQLVQRLLQEEFDLTQDETFLPTRNKLPRAQDETEAEKLWRLRIKYEILQGRLANQKPEETVKTIAKRYERLVRTMQRFSPQEILQTYLSALAHAYDPHSEYLSAANATDFEISKLKLSFIGIGAVLQEEDGYIKIMRLIPGGPADLSKQLQPNDRIMAVAQGEAEPVDTIDMKLRDVVELIRGPKNTEVRLTIIPAEAPDGTTTKVVRLVRDEVKLTEQKARARVIDYPDGSQNGMRFGVITLPQFYERSAADVEKLLSRLNREKIGGLILDLRRNSGGILSEAIELAGLFIQRGPVVQVKNHRKVTQVLEDKDPKVAYDGPLVVLVGRLSASASEIVAAALQDYGRAVIVGDQATHGKGTVQAILSLNQIARLGSAPDLGKLKLTQAKFYRVAGGTTQKVGVIPDLTLPSVFDHLDLGEASLENSLPADEISPLAIERMDLVKPYVAQLQMRSSERVTRSADFAYIYEDIELLRKQRANRDVSLNEAKRMRDKTERENRLKTRKHEQAQRSPTLTQVFQLSLDMVEHKQPLEAYTGRRLKTDSTAEPANAGPDRDGVASDTEPVVDVHLEETLNILSDYSKLRGHPANFSILEEPRSVLR